MPPSSDQTVSAAASGVPVPCALKAKQSTLNVSGPGVGTNLHVKFMAPAGKVPVMPHAVPFSPFSCQTLFEPSAGVQLDSAGLLSPGSPREPPWALTRNI